MGSFGQWSTQASDRAIVRVSYTISRHCFFAFTMKIFASARLPGAFTLALCTASAHAAGDSVPVAEDRLARLVADTVRPVMAQYDVPGMAVAVTVRGKSQVFNFGLASKADATPVTDTRCSRSGRSARRLRRRWLRTRRSVAPYRSQTRLASTCPDWRVAASMRSACWNSGRTAGGLPLQFPDAVTTSDQMLAYFKD
jgi:beta-lactamase class C